MEDCSFSSELSDLPPSEASSSSLSEMSKSPSISPRNSFMDLRPDHSSRLLSPPSTLPSGSASPMKSSDPIEPEIHVNSDGPPPAKRRKTEPKVRTTERLSLNDDQNEPSLHDEKLVAQLKNLLRKKKKIVCIAGAGVSVAAGIPDFRSANGLFSSLRSQHKLGGSGKQLFDASVYKHNDTTEQFHTMIRDLDGLAKNAQPTAFHHLIASLAQENRLLRLYSQNVDGLDTSLEPLATNVPLNMKGPWPKTIQLHGSLAKMRCSKCSKISDFDASLFEGPEAPLCKECVEMDTVRTAIAGRRSHGIGRLRPRMVLYNEHNEDQEAIANVVRADLRSRPDAVIVVGTSLKIPGVRNMVKDMCRVTRERKGGVTAWINLDPEPTGADVKDCWDLIVRGKSDDVAHLAALPRWDSIQQGAETIVDDQEVEASLRRGGKVEVEIRRSTPEERTSPASQDDSCDSAEEPKLKSVNKVQGIPTPSASPKLAPRTALPTKSSREKSKPKQSELSFKQSRAKPTQERKPAKVQKTAPRKPRQTKKSDIKSKPKSTVTDSFKATKATAIVSKLPSKGEFSLDDFSLRPSPLKKEITTPTTHPTTPTTPTDVEDSLLSTHTVSPGSKPRGLETFIA